jgi:ornithine cyclodeaminase/alanine dehydrogenase-like protein (mu-crystallin family)
MLHLSDRVVADLVDERAAEGAVWTAFAAWGRGAAATTQRVRAAVPAHGPGTGGTVSAMAATVAPYCGGKLYATNQGRFTFVNVVFHVDGRLLAVLDGDAVTALRTPAISSLAIHHLARPAVRVAALVGAGRQAWPHLTMLARTLPQLTEIRLASRPGSAALAALHERAIGAGLPVALAADPTEAVAGAQVIVTVTNARLPLFPAEAVADDALICAVGATKYDRAEITSELVERCGAVVCDDAVGSRAEAGDLIAAAAAGRFDWSRAVELHAVAAGTVEVPRAGARPVLFESQGVAIADVAVCGLAYERAVAAGLVAADETDAARSEPTSPP